MKPLIIIVSGVFGAAVGAGALYWRDARTLAALQRQTSDLQARLTADSDKQARETTESAARIDELTHKLEAAQVTASGFDRERQRLEAELMQARRALAATQRDHVGAQKALADSQTTIAQLSGAPTAATPVSPRKVMDAAAESAARSNMQQRFAGLIQKLGLNAADADRFIGLMVSRQQAADDVIQATQAAGGTATIGTTAQMVGSTLDSVDADIRALLGDSGYAQYRGYQASLGNSGTITRLQTNLADSAPLSDSQAQQLQQLITDSGVGHLTPVTIDRAKAAGFLSPEQLQVLQTLYEQQRAAQLRRRTGAATPKTEP